MVSNLRVAASRDTLRELLIELTVQPLALDLFLPLSGRLIQLLPIPRKFLLVRRLDLFLRRLEALRRRFTLGIGRSSSRVDGTIAGILASTLQVEVEDQGVSAAQHLCDTVQDAFHLPWNDPLHLPSEAILHRTRTRSFNASLSSKIDRLTCVPEKFCRTSELQDVFRALSKATKGLSPPIPL